MGKGAGGGRIGPYIRRGPCIDIRTNICTYTYISAGPVEAHGCVHVLFSPAILAISSSRYLLLSAVLLVVCSVFSVSVSVFSVLQWSY